jgi:RNA polymerase sigma-54 factor
MEARLQLRQTQRLVMTPMLQQAIQLLQLSTVELQELLQKELTENPVLEEAPAEEEAAAPEPGGEAAPPAPAEPAAPEPAPDSGPDLPFDISEVMFGPPEERSLVQQEEHEDTRIENFLGSAASLADHLAEQLRLSTVEPDVREAAEYVIGNVDEDGYVPATLVLDRALAMVQRCEPAGVGARDLRECLLLQLGRQAGADPLAALLVAEHFAALAPLLADAAGEAADAATVGEVAAALAWQLREAREHLDALRAAPGLSPEARAILERHVPPFLRYAEAARPGRRDPERVAERLADLARVLGVTEAAAAEAAAAVLGAWEARVRRAVEAVVALERRPGRRAPAATGLAAHLHAQLGPPPAGSDLGLAVEAVVGALDPDGYLRIPLEDLAARTRLPVIERALALVQRLDPPGVGARSIRECLLLQLRQQEAPDPLAVQILEEHYEAFQRCRYADLARLLRVDQAQVTQAVEAIARLEPKPGRRFGAEETRYVVPDVHVHKVGDDYAIVLNDEGIPRLRINGYYRSMIARAPGDEARRYVEDRLRSAVWLIKSVHQRQKTLYKVAQSIVHFQRAFLEHGVSHLRPLSLRHVAEDIGMHESTVSRVTTNKYVETPQGLFELKFFFHSGIAKEHGGEEVSSISVKQMIEGLVAHEDVGKPLSDQDITRLLKERGLNIARRTVAKYREELGIFPSHQRRLQVRRRG